MIDRIIRAIFPQQINSNQNIIQDHLSGRDIDLDAVYGSITQQEANKAVARLQTDYENVAHGSTFDSTTQQYAHNVCAKVDYLKKRFAL